MEKTLNKEHLIESQSFDSAIIFLRQLLKNISYFSVLPPKKPRFFSGRPKNQPFVKKIIFEKHFSSPRLSFSFFWDFFRVVAHDTFTRNCHFIFPITKADPISSFLVSNIFFFVFVFTEKCSILVSNVSS